MYFFSGSMVPASVPYRTGQQTIFYFIFFFNDFSILLARKEFLLNKLKTKFFLVHFLVILEKSYVEMRYMRWVKYLIIGQTFMHTFRFLTILQKRIPMHEQNFFRCPKKMYMHKPLKRHRFFSRLVDKVVHL